MRLEEFLKDHNVRYEKHTHPVAYTSQQLADAEHVSGYMVAKPVIVKGASEFAMCVITAPAHLDLKRAAEALNEKEVRLATEPEMADLFPGCELGAEPPIGTMFGMKTVVDEVLKEDEYLVMQAGTHTESVRVSFEDWERVCRPVLASITAR